MAVGQHHPLPIPTCTLCCRQFRVCAPGITGGVVSTKDFQEAFFPSALGRTDSSYYCHYNNEILQLFASIMRAFLLPLHRDT